MSSIVVNNVSRHLQINSSTFIIQETINGPVRYKMLDNNLLIICNFSIHIELERSLDTSFLV